jgi:hypothetical protein
MSDGPASAPIESRSAKELAEVEKLNAEIRIIKDQLSLKYNLREWLKAITGIAALGALLWSVITGFDQLQQARQDKQRDALERALNRLVSANAVERVVGANSVRAFLSGYDVRQRSIALISLAGAIAQEHDVSARSSVLAAFRDLGSVPKTDLQYALSIVFEANRTLFAKEVADQSSQLFAGPFATRMPRVIYLTLRRRDCCWYGKGLLRRTSAACTAYTAISAGSIFPAASLTTHS